MPIYRFKCDHCGSEFTAILDYGDWPKSCDKCISESLTRLISTGVSSHYVGDGFTKAPKRTKKEIDKDE